MSISRDEEISGWLAGAIISCQPIDQEHVDVINDFLPGLHSLAVAVVFPNREHHVLQTCFNLDLDSEPCTGQSAIFSSCDALLANTVYGTGKALLCPASKSNTFVDVKNLLKGSVSCSSAACIPLLQLPSPPISSLENSSATTPSTRPFGSLCIAFQHDIIPKETVAAAHSLSRALASHHGEALRSHAETIISCLGASMHPSSEDLNDSKSYGYDDDDDEEEDEYEEEPTENVVAPTHTSNDEASCSRSPPQERLINSTPMAPLVSSTTPLQSYWMTFKDPALEKGYVDWSAQHMRCLDPAAALFDCIYFCAMGFAPSFKMATKNPLVYASGWIVLVPILLCMLPGFNHIYVAHREMWLLVFHAVSATWQVATANTTKYLGPSLFVNVSSNPAAAFLWQFINLVMFQVRWKFVVVIATTVFITNTIPLAPGLCKLFKEHQHIKVDDTSCVQKTILFGALQVLAAVVVLRINECRMRRLFLNSLQTKQQSRQPTRPSSSSSSRAANGSILMACLGIKAKVM